MPRAPHLPYTFFLFLLSSYFLIAYRKRINANGKMFPTMPKLCLLEPTSTPRFSCHFFFPTDQGRFCFVLHFYSCNLWQTRRCAADRISLCHFERAALVSKAILASLTFKGVPVSEMNGLTRKCADNKERNGYV